MVVPLLFGYTVVMKFTAGIRGCTCDEGFARMSEINTWITIECWAGILVVMTLLFAYTDVTLEGNASVQDSGTVIVMLLLFAITAVMLVDVVSSQQGNRDCGALTICCQSYNVKW